LRITKAHLSNIIIDGAALALRDTSVHRVPDHHNEESAHERAASGA
jgi:hypothetical protein